MSRRLIVLVIVFSFLLIIRIPGIAQRYPDQQKITVSVKVVPFLSMEQENIQTSFEYEGRQEILPEAFHVRVATNVPWVLSLDLLPIQPGLMPRIITATIIPQEKTLAPFTVPIVGGQITVSEIGRFDVIIDLGIPASNLAHGVYPLTYIADLAAL